MITACPKCNAPIAKQGSRFCNQCGFDLRPSQGFPAANTPSSPLASPQAGQVAVPPPPPPAPAMVGQMPAVSPEKTAAKSEPLPSASAAPAAGTSVDDTLARELVSNGLISAPQLAEFRQSKAKNRSLYRALREEKLVSEMDLCKVIAQVLSLPLADLKTFSVNSELVSRFPAKLARTHFVFPMAEADKRLTLAVADPTDKISLETVRRQAGRELDLKVATFSEIHDLVERHYGPKLIGVLPSGEKIEFAITRNEVEIGKAPHNHLILNEQTVSSVHAVILSRDGGYRVVDLGSSNGTRINGDALDAEGRILRHGDKIQLGAAVLTFRNDAETPANATAALSAATLDEISKRFGVTTALKQSVAVPPKDEKSAVAGAADKKQDAPAASSESEDKKKKKDKEKGKEDDRLKAALINSFSRIAATVLGTVLTALTTVYVIRSTSSSGSSANQPPVPNAGADVSVKLPESVRLAGTASDDGQPANSKLTYAWSKVSGAGNVTFTSADAASTSVSFSDAGTYVLRLTVSDGAQSGTDEMSVTVTK